MCGVQGGVVSGGALGVPGVRGPFGVLVCDFVCGGARRVRVCVVVVAMSSSWFVCPQCSYGIAVCALSASQRLLVCVVYAPAATQVSPSWSVCHLSQHRLAAVPWVLPGHHCRGGRRGVSVQEAHQHGRAVYRRGALGWGGGCLMWTQGVERSPKHARHCASLSAFVAVVVVRLSDHGKPFFYSLDVAQHACCAPRRTSCKC